MTLQGRYMVSIPAKQGGATVVVAGLPPAILDTLISFDPRHACLLPNIGRPYIAIIVGKVRQICYFTFISF